MKGGPTPLAQCVMELSYFIALRVIGSIFSTAVVAGQRTGNEAERDNLSRSDITNGETASPQRRKLDRSRRYVLITLPRAIPHHGFHRPNLSMRQS